MSVDDLPPRCRPAPPADAPTLVIRGRKHHDSISTPSKRVTPEVLVDWLAWTEHERCADEVCEWLGGSWAELPQGARGYSAARSCGGIRVLYAGRPANLVTGQPGMGVHVSASGQGVRELEERWGLTSSSMAALLGQLAPRIARLDLAVDDREGLVDLGRVTEAVHAGTVVSRWRSSEVHESVELDSGRSLGRSAYLGRRVSDMYCRIYDKAAQMGVEGTWNRVEIEAKRERARALAALVSVQGLRATAGVLRGYVDFKVRTEDGHRDRWPTAWWWTTFLHDAAAQRLAVDPACARDMATAIANLERQFGPTLAVIVQSRGVMELVGMAQRGEARIRSSHRELLSGDRALRVVEQ